MLDRRTPSPALVLGVLLLAAGCGGGGGEAAAPTVETIAGGAVGDGRLAIDVPLLPVDVALDANGNVVVANRERIRRIDARTRRITTLAGNGRYGQCGEGGPALDACLGNLTAVAVGPDGAVYAAEWEGRVLRIEPGGTLTRVAGKLPEQCAGGSSPRPVPERGVATCLLGPIDLVAAADGGLYVGEVDGWVSRLDVASGILAPVAGIGKALQEGEPCQDDVPATTTCTGVVAGIALAPDGALLVSSARPYAIRRVDPATGLVATLAGTGVPCAHGEANGDGGPARAACVWPGPIVVAPDGPITFVDGQRLRSIDPATGVVASLPYRDPDEYAAPTGLALDGRGGLVASWLGIDAGRVLRIDPARDDARLLGGNGTGATCGDGGPAVDACLDVPLDAAVAPDGDVLLLEVGGRVRRIDVATGDIATVAGGGPRLFDCPDGVPAIESCFHSPRRAAAAANGDVFVLDRGDADDGLCDRVRRIEAATGTITTAFGRGDSGVPETCSELADVAVGPGGELVVASYYYVWRVPPPYGAAERIAGQRPNIGAVPTDGMPALGAYLAVADVAVDAAGDVLIMSAPQYGEPQVGTVTLLRLDRTTGRLVRVAGGGIGGLAGDGGPARDARIVGGRVVIEPSGDLLLGGSGLVRRIAAATGLIDTVAGDPATAEACGFDGGVVYGPLPCVGAAGVDPFDRVVWAERDLDTGVTLLRRLALGR